MPKRTRSRKASVVSATPAKPARRRGWLGVAIGGVACLGAIVYVAAEGLSQEPIPGGDREPAAAAPVAGVVTPVAPPSGSAPVKEADPAEVAALASLTGKELPADVQMLLDGTAPKHLQYDAAKNQHWWAPHNHWHPGPPPAAAATPVAAPFDPNAPAVMPDGSPAVPWEYDAVNNRYWHPGHGHWHQGPPPPEGQRE